METATRAAHAGPILVSVIAADFASAGKSTTHNAFALATARALGQEPGDVCAYPDAVFLTLPKRFLPETEPAEAIDFEFPVTLAVARFISACSNGETVGPHDFVIDIESEEIRRATPEESIAATGGTPQ